MVDSVIIGMETEAMGFCVTVPPSVLLSDVTSELVSFGKELSGREVSGVVGSVPIVPAWLLTAGLQADSSNKMESNSEAARSLFI